MSLSCSCTLLSLLSFSLSSSSVINIKYHYHFYYITVKDTVCSFFFTTPSPLSCSLHFKPCPPDCITSICFGPPTSGFSCSYHYDSFCFFSVLSGNHGEPHCIDSWTPDNSSRVWKCLVSCLNVAFCATHPHSPTLAFTGHHLHKITFYRLFKRCRRFVLIKETLLL